MRQQFSARSVFASVADEYVAHRPPAAWENHRLIQKKCTKKSEAYHEQARTDLPPMPAFIPALFVARKIGRPERPDLSGGEPEFEMGGRILIETP
jgi:hypothetical protein